MQFFYCTVHSSHVKISKLSCNVLFIVVKKRSILLVRYSTMYNRTRTKRASDIYEWKIYNHHLNYICWYNKYTIYLSLSHVCITFMCGLTLWTWILQCMHPSHFPAQSPITGASLVTSVQCHVGTINTVYWPHIVNWTPGLPSCLLSVCSNWGSKIFACRIP